MGVLDATGRTGGRCQCVDDLLAPIRSKMKVLKKFKKRMGLGTYVSLFPAVKTNLALGGIFRHRITPDSVRAVR
jgi:hypothetical protein